MIPTSRRAVLVAVVGVVAIAVVAASVSVLPDREVATGGGSGTDAAGPDSRESRSPPPAIGSSGGQGSPLVAVVFVVLALGAAVLLVGNARSTLPMAVGGVAVVTLLGVALWILGQGAAGTATSAGGAPGQSGGGSGGRPGTGVAPDLPVLAPVGLLVVGLLVVAVGAVASRRLGRPGTASDPGDGGDGPPSPDAVGRAAGRAADRIRTGETAADNEVYRCWVEMTDLVEAADPETATPAEFADAAASAGVADDDAARLRRLFEAVRYGGADPADYESRALATFERIEATYVADEGSTDGDGTAGDGPTDEEGTAGDGPTDGDGKGSPGEDGTAGQRSTNGDGKGLTDADGATDDGEVS